LWCALFGEAYFKVLHEWEIERINITLRCQDGKTFQCPKLKLIEVIYNDDSNHQLNFCGALGGAYLTPASNLRKSELLITN